MDLAPDIFRDLAAFIHEESGMVLGPEKSYLVRHRLEPVIRALGLSGFDILIKRLHMRTGAALRNDVIDAITVKETSFFRDKACFDGLLKNVLPACAAMIENPENTGTKTGAGGGRRRIRIWSAAAATGQEAYSLAMLIREYTAANAGGPNERHFTILATDISPAAIEIAKAAGYSSSEVRRGLSDARLHQHCHQRGGRWFVSDGIRRLVQFRIFNLLHPPSADLGAFDVILCRNVLIYFDEATRRKICQNLYSALHPGGWLILGSAESLYGMEGRFETLIHGRSIFYRRPKQKG